MPVKRLHKCVVEILEWFRIETQNTLSIIVEQFFPDRLMNPDMVSLGNRSSKLRARDLVESAHFHFHCIHSGFLETGYSTFPGCLCLDIMWRVNSFHPCDLLGEIRPKEIAIRNVDLTIASDRRAHESACGILTVCPVSAIIQIPIETIIRKNNPGNAVFSITFEPCELPDISFLRNRILLIHRAPNVDIF